MTEQLTYSQKLKHGQRLQHHIEVQRRYPRAALPRRSPRGLMPGPREGVTRTQLVSMRACMEFPEKHPNDYRYLFRRAGTEPQYVWLNSKGQAAELPIFPSLVSAIEYLLDAGWEDASW